MEYKVYVTWPWWACAWLVSVDCVAMSEFREEYMTTRCGARVLVPELMALWLRIR